jgi:hypothetical protein
VLGHESLKYPLLVPGHTGVSPDTAIEAMRPAIAPDRSAFRNTFTTDFFPVDGDTYIFTLTAFLRSIPTIGFPEQLPSKHTNNVRTLSVRRKMYEWSVEIFEHIIPSSFFTAVDEMLRVTRTAQWGRMHFSLTAC